MIAYLEGTVLESSDTLTILKVGHIAYEVHLTRTAWDSNLSRGVECSAYILHHHDSNGVPSLFAFGTFAERQLTQVLIDVQGVGAKLASRLVQSAGSTALVNAILTKDKERLRTFTKGLGDRTAINIVNHFAVKPGDLSAFQAASGSLSTNRVGSAVRALVVIGHTVDAGTIAKLAEANPGADDKGLAELYLRGLAK